MTIAVLAITRPKRTPMTRLLRIVLITAAVCRAGASWGQVVADPPLTADAALDAIDDPHSFAEPWRVKVRHLDLELRVDFDNRQLVGTATYQLERIERDAPLVLDTRDLVIERIDQGTGHQPARFELGLSQRARGSQLTIHLAPESDVVRIHYRTSPRAAALQWLRPEQTAGKKLPFLFTQSQAILARTWIPCQDSPGVRMTYSAKVQVPRELIALMSATNPTVRSESGEYEFRMPQAIPAYLMALAVGDLQFRELGPRSGIYAEPPVVEKAAWEFARTEDMIRAAESLYGPYRWERYDILVLPPSFPFGGMENPRLTFATPTVLAGDRSLVALIAHELAHSWSGNLVTNATWNDFWLNEGFTVYFEHRIMEKLFGRRHDEMLARLGRDALVQSMADMPPRDTWLVQELDARNPDAAVNDVAYEKGYLFLRSLEEAVGRERWDRFLRSYFDRFAFQSMTTEGFIDYVKQELVGDDQELWERLQVDAWLHGPGLPGNAPRIDAPQLDQIAAAAEAYVGDADSELDVSGWETPQWLHFLRSLPRPLSENVMRKLDTAFDFSKSGNSEILHEWLLLAVISDYAPAEPVLERFLTDQGRRKFLMPLYEALCRTDTGRERATAIYRVARPLYHSVSAESIDRLLNWPSFSPEP